MRESIWQIAEDIRMREKNTVNVARTNVKDAYSYARKVFGVNGINIEDTMPHFMERYKKLQNNIKKYNIGIKRIDMPAIRGTQTPKFAKDIRKMAKYGNVDSVEKRMEVGKLKPIQDQIWLDFMLQNYVDFGLPQEGSSITNKMMITSKDGYIIDGHHRYAQVMLADPKIKMNVLVVDLPIRELLELARRYAKDIGNTGNQ